MQVRYRNWRGGGGEIDLICWDRGCWVFVEVKAARGPAAGPPAGWLRQDQQRRWRSAATAFLESEDNDRPGAPIRFDLVAVVDRAGGPPDLQRFQGVEP